MNYLIALYHAHPAMFAAAGYYIFSLLVDTMPEADAGSGKGYLWLYKLLHAAAANIKTARGLKMLVPQQVANPQIGVAINANETVSAAEQARKNNGGSRWDDFQR